MKRRSFVTTLPWAALAVACGRQVAGILSPDAKPVVDIRIQGRERTVTATAQPGTVLEMLQRAFGVGAIGTAPKNFVGVTGKLVTSILDMSGIWLFEINGVVVDTKTTSVDVHYVPSGELVFRQL